MRDPCKTILRARAIGVLLGATLTAGAGMAQVPPDVAARIAAIGRVVDPPATARIYAPIQKTMPVPGVKATRDIAYGSGPRQTLDVFTTQAKAAPKPILIVVHGGGFVGGDKSRSPDGAASPFYDNMMLWAVGHGMVGVNINYEWAPKAGYPEVQHQIAQAMAWARQNAASFGGDPERVILWGHSAGAAHVGSFLAHPEAYADVAGARDDVSAAILTSGAYDMAAPKDHVYYGPSARLEDRSSTAGLVRSRVPLFVICAELDPEPMVVQARALDGALTRAGRTHRFMVAAKHGHMSESYAVNTADESVSGPVLSFIRTYAK
ncbi:MAG: putative esterase/lipase [Caulobacteraceae bacterium]|nr:putative esterase/lipase [Caulobacteraceae bacterium]